MEDVNKPNIKRNIEAINRTTVHKICSGQVVLNLATAVKELVENSLDAGATSIDVRLKDSGSSLVEVSDNGSGVEESNFEALTLKHHTSKLKDFVDLSEVATFGFRGEALSSLCALSDVSIITKHELADIGHKVEYDHNGAITKQTPVARQTGTTVILENIFSTLPVRHKEFIKHLKREFCKMVQVLNAYCLVSRGVRISCTNQNSNGRKQEVVSSLGQTSLQDNIISIFGVKQMQSLMEFKQIDPTEEILLEYNLKDDCDVILRLEGYVSSCGHGQGRASSDRQFYYVNNRPCDPTKLIKLVNEVYHSYNKHQFPFVFLNIELERVNVDVNVTPDKRQIFLQNEKYLRALVKSSLLKMYENLPSTYVVQNGNIGARLTDVNSLKRSFSFNGAPQELPVPKQCKLDKFLNKQTSSPLSLKSYNADDKTMKSDIQPTITFHTVNETPRSCQENEVSLERLTKEPVINSNGDTSHSCKDVQSQDVLSSKIEEKHEFQNKTSEDNQFQYSSNYILHNHSTDSDIVLQSNDSHSMSQCRSSDNKNIPNNESFANNNTLQCESSTTTGNTTTCKNVENDVLIEEEWNLSVENGRRVKNININVEKIEQQMDKLELENKEELSRRFRAKIEPKDNNSAEEELTKEISKDMFEKMMIIGQFNLGFIITKLGSDLFIIDQHATDEKYNFEMLQKNTVIKNQKLVIPQPLQLTAVNQSILVDNLDVFQKNGFEFIINEQDVKLSSVPVSKNWTFDKEDIDEMLFMLQDDVGNARTLCRPSRVRAMFASRSCRKSVMIGTALTNRMMSTLVNHMAEIEQPWNCPHGRPTMRHLINLDMLSDS